MKLGDDKSKESGGVAPGKFMAPCLLLMITVHLLNIKLSVSNKVFGNFVTVNL